MNRVVILAAALLLAGCGASDEDKLSGDLAGAEGTAPIEDAALNGMIDADRLPPELPSPAAETPLADVTPTANVTTNADPLAPAPAATGPSFDCTNAWREAERLICDDPDLATLDRTMAARYFRALKIAGPVEASLLQQTGAAFLRARNRCNEADCVADTYQDRIAEIAEIIGGAR